MISLDSSYNQKSFGQSYKEHKNTHFMSIKFKENHAFIRYMEKYCRDGQVTDDNMAHAHCRLDTQGYKHILRICNTYFFFTATMVTRMRLSVNLYLLFLSYCSHFRNRKLSTPSCLTAICVSVLYSRF